MASNIHIYQGDSATGDLTGTYPSPTVNTNSVLGHLSPYTSLAAAKSGGLASGDFFVLTGILIGVNLVNLIVQVP